MVEEGKSQEEEEKEEIEEELGKTEDGRQERISGKNKYRYRYDQKPITLNTYEAAIARKGHEVVKNHFPGTFSPAQLKTWQSIMKAVGLRYFQSVIETWEQMKKNGDTRK